MKIIAALEDYDFASEPKSLSVVLYGHASRKNQGSAGAAIRETIRRRKLAPTARAWDFLSIALSVMAADLASHRDRSPDGWTREFDMKISVVDPGFWTSRASALEGLLGFLSTDIWHLEFIGSGFQPAPEREIVRPTEDCVSLLSGGLDSFIGAIDLSEQGQRPFAVSQSVRGDEDKQDAFAAMIGGGLTHLRLNHNTHVPDPEKMPSQRARSIIFLAHGILIATTLGRHHAGEEITLNVCENGFISINPPLTDMRLGSLSTRTSHPALIKMLQHVLDAGAFRVRINNPYQHKTKGEMLLEARDQVMLLAHAHRTTSCGRFKRYKYKHCGRCIPCLIRRAAFERWGIADRTTYKYKSLTRNDKERARYDDVMAAAMAVAAVKSDGLDDWLGASVSSSLLENKPALRDVARRGLEEVETFLAVQNVR
jgi:7-cyano-7-deazaguanine synthase in queuosine biosynthesis